MDNVSHTLIGLALARSGVGRVGPYATPALLVAANIADLDRAYLLMGVPSYAEHRGAWSHSLPAALTFGFLVGILFWLLARQKAQPHSLRNLVLVSLLGTYAHLLLDWTTSLGIQLLRPFNQDWYALDWLPESDLWLLLLLLLGLLLPLLFRLISEEIGDRRSPTGIRRGAVLALTACLMLVGTRALFHGKAIEQLRSRLYARRAPLRVGAFASALSPLRWWVVVDTGTTQETGTINLTGTREGFDSLETQYKPSDVPAIEPALESRTMQLFLRRARFPHLEVIPKPDGWRVEFRDLRYTSESGRQEYFAGWVDLNQGLGIVGEGLRWGGYGPPFPRAR